MTKLLQKIMIVAFWVIIQPIMASAQNATIGAWGPIIPSGVNPVAVANLPDGKLLAWSAAEKQTFGGDNGRTYSTIFNPANNSFTETLVTNTGHDMFCPGIANLADGRILVTGGSSSARATIYNPLTNTFTNTSNMNTPRGYHSMVTLGDGRVFTLGGSWSGGLGNKNAEIWSPNGAWTPYPGITAEATVRQGSPDPRGVFRDDNHAWLWLAPNGKVFHAGPGFEMHWLDLGGVGSVQNVGRRGDDQYAMNGNTVMYDIGKILKSGGAPNYGSDAAGDGNDVPALNTAYVIDIAQNIASVRRTGNMIRPRTLHNSIVLPNGEVVIIGGVTRAKLFSDENSVLTAEIWNPTTNTWRNAANMAVPRNYHAVAILLQDGRIFTGGGGLCGNCPANHSDAQIFTPPYLYNANGTLAARPVINAAPATAAFNAPMTITTNQAITSFSLVRLSSATHSVNNEQRRIPLTFTANGTNSYRVNVPNANIVPPGDYFLFALNAAGVPSIAKTIRVGGIATPVQTQIVPNGTYFINSFASPNQRVTNANLVNTATTNTVRMSDAADNNNQKWEFTHLGDNVYTIKNLGNNQFLEAAYGRCENLAPIGTYTLADADWHRWVVTKVGDDYLFRPKHCQGQALDRNAQDNMGAILFAFSVGNNNQKFRLTPTYNVINGIFEIRSPETGQNMIAPTWRNTETIMVNPANFDDQKWQITHTGNGLHTIRNIATGRFLDVLNGGCADGVRVITWPGTGGNNQFWYIDKINNTFYFRPANCPNRALDKKAGRDGLPTLWGYNTANINQQWNLVPTITSTLQNVVINGSYEMRSPETGQNLIAPTWLNSETRMYNAENFDDQKWQITHTGNGLHTIRNIATGLFLDVFNGGCADRTRIITFTGTGRANQFWYIDKVNNTFYFRPSNCPTKALDKQIGRDGLPIIWPYLVGNPNQQWNLIPLTVATPLFVSEFRNTLDATPRADRSVMLQWVVNQKKEVDKFIIQHATEDNEDFEDIETVRSIKELGVQTYSHTSNAVAPGLNYYRIKITFADGSADSTEYRVVFFEEKKAAITMFPNPATDEIFLDLSNYMDEKVQYLISGIDGKIILNGGFTEGHNKQERIALDNFKEGNYIIYTKPEKHRETAKQFVVVK